MAIDSGQINQVVNNLVINAVQAMAGGGTMTVTTANVVVDDEHPREYMGIGPYVEVAIQDEGHGIPPEIQDKIFDPYFTTREKGTGLGLFSAYSIISKHGGWITLESEVGKGTTITFYLPADLDAVIPPCSGRSKVVLVTGRILVMDDDELIRKALRRLLESLGFRVETAADGTKAVELFKAAKSVGKPFGAVILDLTVPGGMGGVKVLQHVREIDPDIGAIVSSGYTNAPIMAHHEDHGFQGRLAKPFTAAELSEVLEQVLKKG